jgi:hypothetical protein
MIEIYVLKDWYIQARWYHANNPISPPHLNTSAPQNEGCLIILNVIASTATAFIMNMLVWVPTQRDGQIALSYLSSLGIVLSQQMLVCFAGSENVRCFTVDHVVACEELLFAHAERNAEYIFDEAHDERGPDDVPADDE